MKRVSLVVLLLACVGTPAPGGEDAKAEPKPRKDAAVVAPEDAIVHKALEKRLSFDFVNTPLADVAAFLSGILKVSLVVDPELPKDTTLSLKAKDMKAAHAVSWVAEAAGGRMVVERGAVYI
ncbi:hypothetical protein HQ576_17785, partial [bacterium]|nr:hypothetical protein [bacterium]